VLLRKLDICLQNTETRSMTVTLNKYHSKWIKDLNIRPENLKLVQERAGNTQEAIGIKKDFLSRTTADQQLRERIDKWDHMKLKSFCTSKEMVSKLKTPPTELVGYTYQNLCWLYIRQGTGKPNTQGYQKLNSQ
jgi:hypothetical protein